MPRRGDVVLPGLDDSPARGDRVGAGWRETVMGRVEEKARHARNHQGNIRDVRLSMFVGFEFSAALNRAAAARGISRVGYLRRAVAAFLAADLGMPFDRLTRECPKPLPYTRERAWVTAGGDDDGTGYGTWHVPGGQTEPAGPVQPTEPGRG